ncbi:hypothetical protein F441_00570 [Phytophthora nicotianae CJ01A1]|uniref:Uncharacterized protein n=2 Tax=Phytophthora nicotianae TaxID=4792 RepID=W2JWM9_PHYNI|nr:hypothetical protein L915_00544 [Phytophthora nicotianae]ETL50177.1 hypothetical protein L916_00543 [Phytophthora nicotianae]ETP26840.1 hypothetical protein F441_00570 [Phytophthora nicotianae CJ01A1]
MGSNQILLQHILASSLRVCGRNAVVDSLLLRKNANFLGHTTSSGSLSR